MPPPDPLSSPALERSPPPDADPCGGHLDKNETVKVLFGDGSWRTVRIMAEQQDRYGRKRILIEWGTLDPPDTFERWFLYDGDKMREGPES